MKRRLKRNLGMDHPCLFFSSEGTPIQQMTRLMHILSGRGNEAYDAFRDGLIHINAAPHLIDLLPHGQPIITGDNLH